MISGKPLTITGQSGDNVGITFYGRQRFQRDVERGTPTGYNLSTINKLIYNGPTGAASEVVFSDADQRRQIYGHSNARGDFAGDRLRIRRQCRVHALLLFQRSSTANVTVTAGSGSNFFVGVMGTGTSA